MTDVPKRTNRYAEMISFGCMLGAVSFYLLSRIESPLRALLQIAAVILLVTGLQLLIRYTMTTFFYFLDEEDNFIVTKQVGRRKSVLCDLTLKLTVAICENKKDQNFEKRYGRVQHKYNCCANLMPEKSHVFIFEFAGKQSAVVFEPSDDFLKEMQARAEKYREKAEE